MIGWFRRLFKPRQTERRYVVVWWHDNGGCYFLCEAHGFGQAFNRNVRLATLYESATDALGDAKRHYAGKREGAVTVERMTDGLAKRAGNPLTWGR